MELLNEENNTTSLQQKAVSFDNSRLEETFHYDNALSETERRALSYSYEEVKSFHSQTKRMGKLLKKRARSKEFNKENQKKQFIEARSDTNGKNITSNANSKDAQGGCLIIYCTTTLGMEKFLKNRSSFHPRMYVQGLLELQEEQRRGIYHDPKKIAPFLEACSLDSRAYALKIASE